MADARIVPGSVVRLAHGGPRMTVDHLLDGGSAACVYWRGESVEAVPLRLEALVVEPGDEPAADPPPDLRAMAESVARGAALLDGRFPGWARLIDPGLLDMGSDRYDLLGLILGGLDEGCARLGIADPTECHPWGFDLPDDAPHAHYGPLTDLWRAAIADRVAPAGEVARG